MARALRLRLEVLDLLLNLRLVCEQPPNVLLLPVHSRLESCKTLLGAGDLRPLELDPTPSEDGQGAVYSLVVHTSVLCSKLLDRLVLLLSNPELEVLVLANVGDLDALAEGVEDLVIGGVDNGSKSFQALLAVRQSLGALLFLGLQRVEILLDAVELLAEAVQAEAGGRLRSA